MNWDKIFDIGEDMFYALFVTLTFGALGWLIATVSLTAIQHGNWVVVVLNIAIAAGMLFVLWLLWSGIVDKVKSWS